MGEDDADTTDDNDDTSVNDDNTDDNTEDTTDDNTDDNSDVDTDDASDIGREFNDNDDDVSDLSAAILGAKSENDETYNAAIQQQADEDMQYYVKITLINMWAILGLIVTVNVVFYFCYCRRQSSKNRRRVMKGFTGDSSDAIGGVSEEENLA